MVESIVVVWVFLLVLLSLVWFSQLVTRKIVLNHAAARVARARTVGFNTFMLDKTARVASIPISGPCLSGVTVSAQYARIPRYLASDEAAELDGCLNYEAWEDGRLVRRPSAVADGRITAEVVRYRDADARRDLLTGRLEPTLTGSYAIEKHADTYMNDDGR